MKQQLKQLDAVAREINVWLLALAIGLGTLDLTIACVLKATALTGSFSSAFAGTAARTAPVPAAAPIEIPPGFSR